jgi:hypothetical protein
MDRKTFIQRLAASLAAIMGGRLVDPETATAVESNIGFYGSRPILTNGPGLYVCLFDSYGHEIKASGYNRVPIDLTNPESMQNISFGQVTEPCVIRYTGVIDETTGHTELFEVRESFLCTGDVVTVQGLELTDQ